MPEVYPQKKALVLRTRDPQKYLRVLEQTQDLGDGVIACKHTLRNFFLARNCGANLKGFEPIRYYYDYPKIRGIDGPMLHQFDTTAFLSTHMRGFDLSEMATGKTASALWAAEYLLQQGVIKKVLILSTLSTLNQVWDEHIFNMLPHRTRVILHGSKITRIKLLKQEVDFYIINHDGIKVIKDWLVIANFDLIIVDEGSRFSDTTTDRYAALVSLIPAKAWVWWLTGTPAAQSPVQAWGQARIINPTEVSKKYKFITYWRDAVMIKHPHKTHSYIPAPGALDEVYEIMQPAIRFKKSDVIDLPPVVYINRECRLTQEQKEAYNKIKKEAVMIHASGVKITAVNAAVIIGKLRQILCGIVKGEENAVVEFDAAPRLELLCEVFNESQSKCIVFVPYTAVLRKVVSYIEQVCGLSVAVIDGGVTGAARGAILTRFQNEENPQVIVANPEAAAHGLNLTAADTVIWYAPIYSAETYLQANERINRPGQKLSMRIVHIMANSLEKKLYDVLRSKQADHESLLKLYEEEIV